MEAQVKKMNGFKSARGFSLSEIEKAGLSIRQVRTLGVYVDPRRRTLHEFNVQTLKTLIEEHQKLKEAQVEEKEEEKKEKRKEKKKEKKVKKVEKKKEIKKIEKEEKERVALTEIKGVGKKKAETLEAAGVSSVEELIKTDTAELAEKTGFSPEYIEKLKEQARAL